MSQSGYTPILIYASGTTGNTPSAANLTSGSTGAELAINYYDGKLFYKDNSGNVQVLASKAGNINVSSISFGTTGLTPNTATTGAVTVAGTLVTSNGGTGLSSYTAGDLPYYASGTALSKLGIGTNGQILTSTGSAPQWSTLSGVAVTTFSAGTTGLTPSSATSGAITLAGTLATTNGGTGLTTFTSNGIVYASSTSALATSGNLTWNGSLFNVVNSSALDTTPIVLTNNYNNYSTGYTGSVSLLAQGYSYGFGGNYNSGKIQFAIDSAFNTPSWQTSMRFYTSPAGTAVGTLSEVARFESGGGYFLIGYTSSNGAYKLQVNSQIFATSNTIATSDGRYKTNVQNITDALSMVCALRPVSFNWMKHDVHNFDLSTPTVGFIAQEVQQALADKPFLNSIVKTNEYVVQQEIVDNTGKVIQPKVTEEFLGIAEGNLISILAQAIKELSAQVTTLQSQVAALTPKS